MRRLRRVVSSISAGVLLSAATFADETPFVVRSDVKGPHVEVVPEYERGLRRVIISFPDTEARAWGERPGAKGQSNTDFVRAAFHELLVAVPGYAEVGILLRERDRQSVLEWDHLFRTHDNVHLHILRDASKELDLWTQDLGEFVRFEGEGRFLVSAVPDTSTGSAHEIATARRHIAEIVFGPSDVLLASFIFDGGNLLFDRVDGGLRVLVGEDVVRHTIDSAARRGTVLSESSVARSISEQFGAAEVVVLRGEQTRALPHIDQAFLILRGGRVVLNIIEEGDSAEKRLLEGYGEQLASLGYQITMLPNTEEDISRFRTSTNAIPFTHRVSGENVVIYPVFPGEVRDGAPIPLGEQDVRGKGAAAFAAYRRAGYLPLPVRDVAHVAGGNTHCIANVLH